LGSNATRVTTSPFPPPLPQPPPKKEFSAESNADIIIVYSYI